MTDEVTELLAALRKIEGNKPDSLGISTQWHRNPEGPQAAAEIERLRAAEAPLRAEIARLREALESIADGMIFPNQLESGFVHGKPTFADMRVRVDFAAYVARAALAQETGDD